MSHSLKEMSSSVNWNELAEEKYHQIGAEVSHGLESVRLVMREVDRERRRVLQSVRSDPDMRKILRFLERVWSVCEGGIEWLRRVLSVYVWTNVKPVLRPLKGVWLRVKEVLWMCVSWLITNGIIFVDSTWFVLCENPAVGSDEKNKA